MYVNREPRLSHSVTNWLVDFDGRGRGESFESARQTVSLLTAQGPRHPYSASSQQSHFLNTDKVVQPTPGLRRPGSRRYERICKREGRKSGRSVYTGKISKGVHGNVASPELKGVLSGEGGIRTHGAV
jgi:hypothetical protein